MWLPRMRIVRSLIINEICIYFLLISLYNDVVLSFQLGTIFRMDFLAFEDYTNSETLEKCCE